MDDLIITPKSEESRLVLCEGNTALGAKGPEEPKLVDPILRLNALSPNRDLDRISTGPLNFKTEGICA
jgi:hypothetical protein